jgi:transcriptional regulator with XRE-family HTH domain
MTGEQLIAWRNRLGMRKGQVCRLLGITYGTLSRYEDGERHDTGGTVVRIPEAIALACTTIAFGLPRWDDPEAQQLLDQVAADAGTVDERVAAVRSRLVAIDWPDFSVSDDDED